jgi:hypothetical protein
LIRQIAFFRKGILAQGGVAGHERTCRRCANGPPGGRWRGTVLACKEGKNALFERKAMKRLLAALFFIFAGAAGAYAQNTSIHYTPHPPNPNRQVPSASHSFAHPGVVNNSNIDWLERGGRLRKKSDSRVIIGEPIIIFVKPDLKDRPKFD